MQRWVKEIFADNNIIGYFSHRCPEASSSKANTININVDKIICRVCWKSRNNFSMFYNKHIA